MNGYWISTENIPEKSSFYYFTKKFELDKKADSFNIKISADTRYRLYINEKFVCEGPCAGGEDTQYYEETDAAKYLVLGKNKISVTVLHAVGNVFETEYRKERPALWFSSVIKFEDGTEAFIVTDESWFCEKENAVELFKGKDHHSSMPPMENVSAEKSRIPLDTVKLYKPDLDRGCIDLCGGIEKYRLEARPIPLFYPEREIKLPLVRKTYCGKKTSFEFDAERYTTDFVRVRYKAEKGARIKIIYAECKILTEEYFMENGEKATRVYKNMRDDENGIIDGAYDILEATGEWQEHTFFWYRAFRFVRAECDGEFGIDIYTSRYVYPFTKNALGERIFSSSNADIDSMWNISINTLECCTHEMFVDCPYYEQAQYMMDGMLESLFAFRLSQGSEIQKKFLVDSVKCQNPDGLIPAKAPSTGDLMIPSFSLFWIMSFREYLRYTGDRAFVKTMTGATDKILSYFDSIINEQGIVGASPFWNFLDWVPGWSYGSPKRGRFPLTVYSMMYAFSLENAAEICDFCDREMLAADYRKRKKSALEAINRVCYDSGRKMYTDIPESDMFSRHTSVWAVLSDAVTGEEATALLKRTFAYTNISKTSFAMNYFTFRALEKAGVYETLAPEVFDGWRKMIDLHCTTWCENPDSPRSECHGWSSTPIYELSAMLLGVYPLSDGFEKVRIRPINIFGVSARGRVPIKDGFIDVNIERRTGASRIDIKSSRSVNMQIELSGKATVNIFSDKYSAEF